MTAEELEEQIEALEAQLNALRGLLSVPRDNISAIKQYGELSKEISLQLQPVKDVLEKIGSLKSTADTYMKNALAPMLQHLATSTEQIEKAMKELEKGYSRIPNAATLIPVDVKQEMQGDTLLELREIRATLEEFSKDKAKIPVVGKIEFVGGDKVEGDKIEQHGSKSKAKIKSDRSSQVIDGNQPKRFFDKYFWPIFSGVIIAVFVPLIVGYITTFSNRNDTYLSSDIVMSLGGSQEQIDGGREKEVKIDKVRKLDPLETGKYIDELPNGIYFFARDNVIICELTEYREECLTSSNKRGRNDFEIQKVDNEYILIGFIGIESYSKIGSTNAENPLRSVVFLPKPWGEITRVVGVKFSKICQLKMRTIDIDENSTMDIFDMCANEVLTNITPHEL